MHTSNTGLLARHMSSSQESRRFRWDGSGGSGEDFSSSSSSSSWYLLWVSVAACAAGSASVASSNGVPAATQTEQTSSKAEEDQPVPIPELQGKKDLYNGMRVLTDSIASEPELFLAQLTAALATWKAAGIKGVWLSLSLSQAALIPLAISKGFDFHHADKGKVMLTAWLPETPNTLPGNASHQVGVGVCVVDAEDRILLVQERSGPAANRGKDFWKMPTGLVDAGEDIAAAAEREVLEETGVRVRFEGVVAFRQQHKIGVEGKTDLFFLCKASPLSHKIIKQDAEIAKAEWIPVDKFLKAPHFPEGSAYWFMNKIAIESFLSHRKALPGYRLLAPPALFKPVELPRGFMPGNNFIFSSCTPPPAPPPTQSKL